MTKRVYPGRFVAHPNVVKLRRVPRQGVLISVACICLGHLDNGGVCGLKLAVNSRVHGSHPLDVSMWSHPTILPVIARDGRAGRGLKNLIDWSRRCPFGN